MSTGKDIFGRLLGRRPAHMNTFLRLDEPKTRKQLQHESGYSNVDGHISRLVQQGMVRNVGRGKGYVINKEWFEQQPEDAKRQFLASCELTEESDPSSDSPTPKQTRYWCVNFDSEECLKYGLKRSLWMMQYQYSHDGLRYQGDTQAIATSKNWKRLELVNPGDFLVAYLPGNRFYAVGKTRTPRKECTTTDTIARVTDEQSHSSTGVVRYTDAFYEDLEDTFAVEFLREGVDQPEIWKYSQRIDVESWRQVAEGGVQVTGVGSLEPRPDYRSAVFEIPQAFFEQITQALGQEPIGPDGEYSTQLMDSASEQDSEGFFEPVNDVDLRERTVRAVVQRRGQPEFRKQLISAYDGHCAVTGCDAIAALEAAHITPYLGPQSNRISNGLLLRADIHTLFDLKLLAIDPDSLSIVLAEPLLGTCYEQFADRHLEVPEEAKLAPSHEKLEQAWSEFRSTYEWKN